jgi:hypothetical protein
MTAELVVWSVVAVSIVVVGLWPLLTRNRQPRTDPRWTVDTARSRIAELEDRLDLSDVPEPARAKAERSLLLAGAALAKGGRKAPARAGRWAEVGLAAIGDRRST